MSISNGVGTQSRNNYVPEQLRTHITIVGLAPLEIPRLGKELAVSTGLLG